MTNDRRAGRWILPAAVVFAATGLVPATLAGDCAADASPELMSHEEGVDVDEYRFKVEVSTTVSCAHVHVDLVVEELLENQQTKRVRIVRQVKLNDGSEEMIVDYRMPAGHGLQSYEARIVSCETCESMP